MHGTDPTVSAKAPRIQIDHKNNSWLLHTQSAIRSKFWPHWTAILGVKRFYSLSYNYAQAQVLYGFAFKSVYNMQFILSIMFLHKICHAIIIMNIFVIAPWSIHYIQPLQKLSSIIILL